MSKRWKVLNSFIECKVLKRAGRTAARVTKQHLLAMNRPGVIQHCGCLWPHCYCPFICCRLCWVCNLRRCQGHFSLLHFLNKLVVELSGMSSCWGCLTAPSNDREFFHLRQILALCDTESSVSSPMPAQLFTWKWQYTIEPCWAIFGRSIKKKHKRQELQKTENWKNKEKCQQCWTAHNFISLLPP